MSLILLEPPAAEPVSLAEMKTFLKVDAAEEDALIEALVKAARMHVETLAGRLLVSQRWRILRDAWPASGRLVLPLAPVKSLDAVSVDMGGGPQPLPTTGFLLDGEGAPPRLAWAPGSLPPPGRRIGGIALEVTAGYGATADVPAPLTQAVRLLAGHWFDNRGLVAVGHEVAALPRAVEALIAPYVVRRLA